MHHMRAFPVAKPSCYSRALGIPSLGHPESSPAGGSASEAVASSPSRGLLARPARTPQHNAPSPPPSPQQRQRPRFTDRPPPLSRTHEAKADQPAPLPSSSSGGDTQAGAQLISAQGPRKCGPPSFYIFFFSSCNAWPLSPFTPAAATTSRPAPPTKVLGVDYGSKWTGLATGIHTTCNPLQV